VVRGSSSTRKLTRGSEGSKLGPGRSPDSDQAWRTADSAPSPNLAKSDRASESVEPVVRIRASLRSRFSVATRSPAPRPVLAGPGQFADHDARTDPASTAGQRQPTQDRLHQRVLPEPLGRPGESLAQPISK